MPDHPRPLRNRRPEKPEPDQRLQALILGFILIGAAMVLYAAIAL